MRINSKEITHIEKCILVSPDFRTFFGNISFKYRVKIFGILRQAEYLLHPNLQHLFENEEIRQELNDEFELFFRYSESIMRISHNAYDNIDPSVEKILEKGPKEIFSGLFRSLEMIVNLNKIVLQKIQNTNTESFSHTK